MRASASVNSEEVAQVNPGQTFTALDSQSNWYKIEYETGKQGWVSANYVTVE